MVWLVKIRFDEPYQVPLVEVYAARTVRIGKRINEDCYLALLFASMEIALRFLNVLCVGLFFP